MRDPEGRPSLTVRHHPIVILPAASKLYGTAATWRRRWYAQQSVAPPAPRSPRDQRRQSQHRRQRQDAGRRAHRRAARRARRAAGDPFARLRTDVAGRRRDDRLRWHDRSRAARARRRRAADARPRACQRAGARLRRIDMPPAASPSVRSARRFMCSTMASSTWDSSGTWTCS